MASNVSGQAYALTILSPIKNEFTEDEVSYADLIRDRLQGWNFEHNSPMALVPQTYLCRFFVLDDVYTESLPGADLRSMASDLLTIISNDARREQMPKEDHLKSRYLVFSCNLHWTPADDSGDSFLCKQWKKLKEKFCGPTGNVDDYLRGMWNAIGDRIPEIWSYCYGFENVKDADSFVAYMKKCQLEAALFFVGSNDDPLEEQLKALYLKQEFAKFATHNQGLSPAELRANFKAFIDRVEPSNLTAPTWSAGQYRI
ncbi:MAG: hypothetical protein ACKN9T_08765 [Candidatus Methylumidiphilus sp.]